jgi:hypothetical protein
MAQGIKGSSPPCSIPDCDNRQVARGWCDKHWKRWRKHGDPMVRPGEYSTESPDGTPETWLPVVGYEGWYEVSDHGRVRRVAGATAGRLLAGFSFNGYVRVPLTRHGQMEHYFVHQLVLAAFVGPCPDGLVCNHKDGDKANNRPANLEWVTHQENKDHAVRTGLWQPFHGQDHPRAKLTGAQVAEIRRLTGSEPTEVTAARFGVSKGTILSIRRHTTWRNLTGKEAP